MRVVILVAVAALVAMAWSQATAQSRRQLTTQGYCGDNKIAVDASKCTTPAASGTVGQTQKPRAKK